MPMRLLEAGSAGQFQERLNADPEFRLVARDMTLSLALVAGNEARLLTIREGTARAIGGFVPLTEPVDITIQGSDAFWAKMLSPVPPPNYQNLYAAVRRGTCEVIGDGELYAAYFPALTRLIGLLRDFENSGARR